jgi:hypothetical protein
MTVNARAPTSAIGVLRFDYLRRDILLRAARGLGECTLGSSSFDPWELGIFHDRIDPSKTASPITSLSDF